jgi:glutamine synthetase
MQESKHNKMMNSKQVIEKIKDENISFVDFWFVDIFGELHCMGMPSYSLSEDDFNDGLEKLDASSILGFKSVDQSDMIMKPDPSTFRILPPD